MAYQFRIVAEIEQLAARLTAPLHSAWRGRPGSEARRALGKIGFWIAQPGLDAACQRQLVALQRSRREVADVATAAKRVELQIAELERRANEDGGQDNTSEQLAELRRQHADLQNSQERATAISRRLMKIVPGAGLRGGFPPVQLRVPPGAVAAGCPAGAHRGVRAGPPVGGRDGHRELLFRDSARQVDASGRGTRL